MTTPNNPSDPNQRAMAEDVKAKAGQASQQAKAEVEEAAQEAKTKTREQLEQQESRAADTMEKVADVTQTAAQQLAERNETTLSQYVSEISDGISKLSNNLKHKNPDELIQQASRLARNNPGLFLLGSVALGFGLSRIAKANRSPGDSESQWQDYGQQDSYAAGARSYDPGAGAAVGSTPASHASTSYLPEERQSMQDPSSRGDSATPGNPTNPGESTGA